MNAQERQAILQDIRKNIKNDDGIRQWDVTENHPANQIRDDHKPYVEKEGNRKLLKPRWYHHLFPVQQQNFDKLWDEGGWEYCEPNFVKDASFASFVRPNNTLKLVNLDTGNTKECPDREARDNAININPVWR